MVKRVPKTLLDRYYELWLTDLTTRKLESTLRVEFPDVSMTKNYFKLHASEFHAYCRHQAQVDTNVRLTEEGQPVEVALTDERRVQLQDYVANGASLQQAADLLDVPLVTITEIWFKAEPELKRELQVVALRRDLLVVGALRRRAMGYELMDRVVKTKVGIVKDKMGNVIPGFEDHETVTTERINHIPGSVAAQELYLINRMGWSKQPAAGGYDADEVEYDVRERMYEEPGDAVVVD